jgi:hypothetical protein
MKWYISLASFRVPPTSVSCVMLVSRLALVSNETSSRPFPEKQTTGHPCLCCVAGCATGCVFDPS